MVDASEEEVSTVFVGGLPPDASQRELDNLCRFMPGYVNSKMDYRRGTTLFARFDTPTNAEFAISMLNNQVFDRSNPGEPIRVVMAKSNMRSNESTIKGPSMRGANYNAPPPPNLPPVGGWRQGSYSTETSTYDSGGSSHKRARIPENPSHVDTVASVGAAEAGFDERALESFFSTLPGFLAFKPNPRMGGGFAKFESAILASEAVAAASEQGIPSAIAKSSMSSISGPSGGKGAQTGYFTDNWSHQTEEQGGMGGNCKRFRHNENPEHVDTVAVVGAAEAGIDEGSLHAFFSQLQGFVAFKPNPRMGGGFAKFESPALANEAAYVAIDQGIPASIAKSSMSTVN